MLFSTLLLQTATPIQEKLGTDIVGQAGKHASENGPLTYFWFAVSVLLFFICIYFYKRSEKATNEKNQACDDAVNTAKLHWAQERAIDNGRHDEIVRELKTERQDLLNRLERINNELRQQESKSIDVIAGLRNALSQVYAQLAQINAFLAVLFPSNGRPTLPPTLPSPTGSAPDSFPPLS